MFSISPPVLTMPTPRSSHDHAPLTLKRREPLKSRARTRVRWLPSASITMRRWSRSARTESCPFACRRWCRRPTSIRHVVDYDRHLRRLRRHYEIRRDALLNGLQHNLTSIEVSGAADLRLLVRLVNAAGEPQRPTPDRPPHLDRTAEPLPTQLHRGRHRVERPSVVGIQPLPPFLWRTPLCPREGRSAGRPLTVIGRREGFRVARAGGSVIRR